MMFPYLSYGLVLFVLAGGFVLGALFGWTLKDINLRRFFDGDGGEPLPFRRRRLETITPRYLDDNVIEFPRRKAS
jgi:hypothetical protein